MPVIQEQTTKSDINVNQTSAQKTEELTRNLCSASAKITAELLNQALLRIFLEYIMKPVGLTSEPAPIK
jgi:hypothetical protein